ncbi:MAG: universal stress protein [Acidimicrobiales bacterium]
MRAPPEREDLITMTTNLADEIVVAIGSAATDNPALAVGIEFARLTNLPLRLVHVACDGATIDADALDEHLQTTAPDVPVSIVSTDADDVVGGIVGELTPRSLAILKSTNASRWSGKSSVAEHVLDAFPGLIAMVGPEVEGSTSFAGPVVIALDGSTEAERALPVARELATAVGQEIVATRVVAVSASDDERRSAAAYLEATNATLPGSRPALPDSNDPISAILATATDEAAGLIVLSSHGDRASERATISRTSMGLVHSATVPVLLVGPEVA